MTTTTTIAKLEVKKTAVEAKVIKLRDVIHNGSCCRKGGNVILLDTIRSGEIPDTDSIEKVYKRDSKGFKWASQAFKSTRFLLQYADGERAGASFFLDGKFSHFLQSDSGKVTDKKSYTELDSIEVGQIWKIEGSDNNSITFMVKAEVRGGYCIAFHEPTQNGLEWIDSAHPVNQIGMRASLSAHNGQLIGSVDIS